MLNDAAMALRLCTREGDADALSIANDILESDPMNADAMFIAGTALFRMEQKGIATLALNAAAQIKPEQGAIWNNLGCCLQEWRPKDAVAVFGEALEREPDNYEAQKNLAAVLGRIGRRDEAIRINKSLRERFPDDFDISYNLALDLLHTDDWESAFEAYVTSEGNAQRTIRNYHADTETPRWDRDWGADTVVIYGEQGVGDEILASSAYNLLRHEHEDTRFILECDPRLEKIFKRSFPWATVYGTRNKSALEWPTHERPEASLIAMAAFGAYARPCDRVDPWLKPDPQLVEMFRAFVPGDLKIGLAWSGGATAWDRAERSVPVEVLGPVISTPNATLVGLEYQDGPVPEGVMDIPWATRKGVDMDVTAALIASLDVVISVPQTACDIAGAVGTPIVAMVSENPPWRFAEAAGDAWIWKDCKTFRKEPGTSWMPVVTKLARWFREERGLM